ncbi:hypothetical protein Poly59_30910 [Rubripirellula reticaptiva]|uniref:Uncharacterized protein n=1 Tax=Rubripirellula reticaptiva TaxID=2528013 RepID=A0A5C6EVI4_9BACT|nr:hypothetical protein Poly59_30910 [Rubripirellula reticaptiva]
MIPFVKPRKPCSVCMAWLSAVFLGNDELSHNRTSAEQNSASGDLHRKRGHGYATKPAQTSDSVKQRSGEKDGDHADRDVPEVGVSVISGNDTNDIDYAKK